MVYLEYVLWAYFILNPLYIFLTYQQEKQCVIERPSLRAGMYRSWMLHLLAPLIVLMVLINQSEISLGDIGLKWHWDLVNILGVTVLIAILGYLGFSLKQLNTNHSEHPAIRKQLEYIKWMTPTTRKEANYFILGLSVTAGICEELLFRGYLMLVLGESLPAYAVVIVSSIVFGLPHLYQGAIHIVRTSILGAIMALIYIVSDSIIIPIVLHVALDMYGGAMAYIVFSKQNQSAPNDKPNAPN